MLRWCTICRAFVRWPELLSWVGDHVLLLTSEEHSEVSVGSSVCWVLFYPREFTAVSEGGLFPCPVWRQHYSGKLDLPAVLASCAHPVAEITQALQASARKIWFLPRRLAGLTVLRDGGCAWTWSWVPTWHQCFSPGVCRERRGFRLRGFGPL